MVWCGLWAGGIIGPYFFKTEDGRNVTVNGKRPRAMISNFLLPKMEELDLVDMWFPQDGVTCHTALNEFSEQLISRNGSVSWPPRSCDLMLDFCFGVTWNLSSTPTNHLRFRPLKKTLLVSLARYRPQCSNEWSKIGGSVWT